MTTRLERLTENLKLALDDKLSKLSVDLGEITIECKTGDLLAVCATLRDRPELRFEQLMDLCGVDYADFGDGLWDGPRYAVVCHFLSISLNQRVRLRVFAADRGYAHLLLTVAGTGRVTDCGVLQSSGNAQVDQALCGVMVRQSRWTGARDTQGRPITVKVRYTATWSKD